MEYSTPTNTTAPDDVRIIANDDIAEAGEIIDDMKNLEENQSHDLAERTIKDLKTFLLSDIKLSKCTCSCCSCNNKMNNNLYTFLKSLMDCEAAKFHKLRRLFAGQKEEEEKSPYQYIC